MPFIVILRRKCTLTWIWLTRVRLVVLYWPVGCKTSRLTNRSSAVVNQRSVSSQNMAYRWIQACKCSWTGWCRPHSWHHWGTGCWHIHCGWAHTSNLHRCRDKLKACSHRQRKRLSSRDGSRISWWGVGYKDATTGGGLPLGRGTGYNSPENLIKI